jgi:PhnB protein
MMQMSPYLFFDGRCEEAFRFYEGLLGGKILRMMTHEGAPTEGHCAPGWEKKIMHARMTVGEQVLMGSDAPPEYFVQQQGFCVNVSVDEPAEAERIFKALSEGGKIDMPMEETFWAHRFGMVVDRFGIPWTVNCEKS